MKKLLLILLFLPVFLKAQETQGQVTKKQLDSLAKAFDAKLAASQKTIRVLLPLRTDGNTKIWLDSTYQTQLKIVSDFIKKITGL